jgi:hypothetical protein
LDAKKPVFDCAHRNINDKSQTCSQSKGRKQCFEKIKELFNPIRIEQQPKQHNTAAYAQEYAAQNFVSLIHASLPLSILCCHYN